MAMPNDATRPWEWLSFRSIKYFLVWLMLWQGSMVSGSIFQIGALLSLPGYINANEVLLAVLLLVVVAERSLEKDFSIRRSYFAGPLILMFLVFFASWCRACYINQRIAFILEIHEVFELPI